MDDIIHWIIPCYSLALALHVSVSVAACVLAGKTEMNTFVNHKLYILTYACFLTSTFKGIFVIFPTYACFLTSVLHVICNLLPAVKHCKKKKILLFCYINDDLWDNWPFAHVGPYVPGEVELYFGNPIESPIDHQQMSGFTQIWC